MSRALFLVSALRAQHGSIYSDSIRGRKEAMHLTELNHNDGFQESKVKSIWDFPGGPVVRTPRFHCRGQGFDPWSGN